MAITKRDYSKEGKVNVTTNLKSSIHKLAQENKIAWNQALEFGVLFLLAEQDGGIKYEYPESKLKERLKSVISNLNNKCEELAVLEDLEKLKNKEEVNNDNKTEE